MNAMNTETSKGMIRESYEHLNGLVGCVFRKIFSVSVRQEHDGERKKQNSGVLVRLTEHARAAGTEQLTDTRTGASGRSMLGFGVVPFACPVRNLPSELNRSAETAPTRAHPITFADRSVRKRQLKSIHECEKRDSAKLVKGLNRLNKFAFVQVNRVFRNLRSVAFNSVTGCSVW